LFFVRLAHPAHRRPVGPLRAQVSRPAHGVLKQPSAAAVPGAGLQVHKSLDGHVVVAHRQWVCPVRAHGVCDLSNSFS